MSLDVAPARWQRKRVGELARIEIGRTPSRNRPELWDPRKTTYNRWVTIADMQGTRLCETSEYISDLAVRQPGAKLVPIGTPLMSFKLTVGRVVIPAVPVYTNEAIAAFYPTGELDRDYLAFALPLAVKNVLSDQAAKGKTLNLQKLRAMELLVPPRNEQLRIVDTLAVIDHAIEKTEAVIEATERLRDALLQELLTRGVPGWHSEWKYVAGVGPIPERWDVMQVGNLVKFTSGVGKRTAELHPESNEYFIPVYGGNGISGYTNSHVTTESAVVIGRVGQKCGTVHITSGPSWITDNALYSQKWFVDVYRPFLALALQQANLNAIRNRNDLPLVTQEIVHAVLVPVPRKEEQQAIVALVATLDSRLAGERRVLEQLCLLKSDLATELLTGARRIRTSGTGDG